MKKAAMIFAVTILAAVAASAQSHPKYIGMTRAKKIAYGQVAGKIKSAELEKEHGKVIYSFDIRGTDGKNHEVNIDALTGRVIAADIETPADEAKEKADDRKAKKH